MYLVYNDVANFIHEVRGAHDPTLTFYTVTDQSAAIQPKGIFVPLSEESGELKEALANGAIAAIWDKEKQLPRYTPNYFPVFLVEDPEEALRMILKHYIDKLDGETEKTMNITKFDFLKKKLLNKNKQSYDIAVMLNELSDKFNVANEGRRG
jgi:UDP-N-acetylmuramyl pentapeptide synthase